jgi:hypothetical protein
MKKGLIIVLIAVLILLISAGVYLYLSSKGDSKQSQNQNNIGASQNINSGDCTGRGGEYTNDGTSEKTCCEGLQITVAKPDVLSIAGKCYWTGVETEKEKATCSNCGNGACESPEDLCQCPQDCKQSTYSDAKEFCDNDYDTYCTKDLEIPEGAALELCELC